MVDPLPVRKIMVGGCGGEQLFNPQQPRSRKKKGRDEDKNTPSQVTPTVTPGSTIFGGELIMNESTDECSNLTQGPVVSPSRTCEHMRL